MRPHILMYVLGFMSHAHMEGFSQPQHFLQQDVFLQILESSLWVLLHYFKKHFLSILKIQVLEHQEFKDPNSYVNLNLLNCQTQDFKIYYLT